MTLELTVQQSQAVQEAGHAVRLLDPQTKQAYVLIPAESYERTKELFADDPLSFEERRTILKGVWKRADWDDPLMDDYASLVPVASEIP